MLLRFVILLQSLLHEFFFLFCGLSIWGGVASTARRARPKFVGGAQAAAAIRIHSIAAWAALVNVKHGESCDYSLPSLPSYPRWHRRKDEERTQVFDQNRAGRCVRGRYDAHFWNRRLFESRSRRIHLFWHQKQKRPQLCRLVLD